jgi:hypothetical protein
MDNMGGSAPPPPPPPPDGGMGGTGGGSGGFAPMALGDILGKAFELYRDNAMKLIQLLAIVVVPLTLVQAFFVRVWIKPCDTTEINTLEDLSNAIDRCTGGIGRGLLIGALSWFVAILIQQLILGALTHGAAGALIGRPVDANASYKYALSRIGGLILLALLIGLVVFAGFFLLIIGALIFAVFLSMATPAFIIERKGVTQSMSRSWDLVSGSWWHVFGVIVVATIIAGIVSGIVTAIAGNDNFFLYWIFSTIGTLITAPFVALVGVVLYVDLRARREGLDAAKLQAELDQPA